MNKLKKIFLLAVVTVLGVAAMAQASTVAFGWGANFSQFSDTKISSSDGTEGSLTWYVDDFAFGFRGENNILTAGTHSDTVGVMELTADKFLSKAVFVGLGVGSANTGSQFTSNGGIFHFPSRNRTLPLIDVRGGIQLLAGKGEKVNASLDFNIIARFISTSGKAGSPFGIEDGTTSYPGYPTSNLNCTVSTIGVTIGL